MSAVASKPVLHGGAAIPSDEKDNFLTHTSGFLSWAMTLDHKRIGLMYLAGVSASFLLGGILALMIRAHLYQAEGALFSNKVYNQIFTDRKSVV